MTIAGMYLSTWLFLMSLIAFTAGVSFMIHEWHAGGSRYLTANVFSGTAAALLLIHKWVHKLTVLHVVLIVAAYALGLGLLLLVVQWRTRGKRYLMTVALSTVTLAFATWQLGYKPPRKPKEYEAVKNRVVRGFEPQKATRITLHRHGKTLSLEKNKGRWLIVKPIRFPADDDVVENLLTEIKMLDKHRTLDGPRTKAVYGLGSKAVQVVVVGATPKPLTLTLGALDVTGARIYLGKDADPKVLLVNKHFSEALDKSLDDLRQSAALPFKEKDVRSVDLSTPGGKRAHLTVHKKLWTLRLGAEQLGQRANAKTAESLVRKLKDLRATKFLGDGAAAISRFGLGKPRQTMTVDDGSRHTLLLGGPCPGRRADRVAARKGTYPAVFCLRAKELKDLTVRPDDLRDARLTGISETSVKRITLTAKNRKLEILKKDLDWDVLAPKDASLKKASGPEVEKYVRDLQGFTVLKFLPPPKDGLAKLGLDKPRAVLTLEDDSGRKETISLGAEDPDKNYYAQRSGEQMVVIVHRSAGELLQPTLLRFRSRSILSFRKEPTEAVRILARTGAITEEAVYEGGLWSLKKPDKVKVDADAMDALLSVLAMLQAERFVSASPLPDQGLTTPTRVITVDLEMEDIEKGARPGASTRTKKQTHTIKVGRDAPDGGCFAQMGAPRSPVFLLAAAACRDLRALLADRRLAELRISQVTGLKLTRGGGTEQLVRQGKHWNRKNGPRVDTTNVDNLLTDLAQMRALKVVAYGLPRPEHGLARPQLVVEVLLASKGSKPIRLLIGAPVKEKGKVVGNYAARAGRRLVYLLDIKDVAIFKKAKF